MKQLLFHFCSRIDLSFNCDCVSCVYVFNYPKMLRDARQYKPNSESASYSILDLSLKSQTSPRQETKQQPNDLWRFFKSGKIREKVQDRSSAESSDGVTPFEATDWQTKISPSRMKSVLEVLEIYEQATSSWAGSGMESKSRSWFPPPEKTPLNITPQPLTKKSSQNPDPIQRRNLGKLKTQEEKLEIIEKCNVASLVVFLDGISRESVLKRCPAKLSRLSCDHVNLITSPDPRQVLNAHLGKCVKLTAFGEKCGIISQVLAVKLPTELSFEKRHAHLTVSYVERISRKSISEAQTNHCTSYSKWTEILPLTGTIGLKLNNGNKIFSFDEFFLETGVDLQEFNQQVDDGVKEGDGMRPSEEIQKIKKASMEQNKKLIDDFKASQRSSIKPMLSCKEIEENLISKQQNQEKLEKQEIIKEGIARLPNILPYFEEGNPSVNFKAQQASLREKAEEHRKSAKLNQKLSFDCLNSARLASKEGDWKKAEAMKQASKEASKNQRNHDQEAEKLAFEANNLGRINTHTIDLHHLHLPEALARLKQLIDGLTAFVEGVKTIYRLRIITGKGINSLDKIPVLRPAVLQFLEKHALPGQIDDSNHGVILTYIKPKPLN